MDGQKYKTKKMTEILHKIEEIYLIIRNLNISFNKDLFKDKIRIMNQ